MPDQTIIHWQPDRGRAVPPMPPGGPVTARPLALWRGLRCKCPGCGRSPIFHGYLTVTAACPVCRTPLGEARADDAPPYFTILVVAHCIIPAMLLFERLFTPGVWAEAALFVPLTFALTAGLLRPIKGATVALMLSLNMLKPADAA